MSLLFSVTLVGVGWLRRAPAVTRHALWTTVFAAVLTLPLLAWTLPVLRVPLPIAWTTAAATRVTAENIRGAADGGVLTEIVPSADRSSTRAPLIEAGPSSSRDAASAAHMDSTRLSPVAVAWPSLTTWLLVVWLMGTAAAAAGVFLSLLRVRRLARAAEDVNDSGWRSAAAGVASRLGLRRPVRLLVSASVGMPMAGGVWRPTVYLPVSARMWSAERRDIVLAHEIAHLAGRDPLRHLVARLAVALYWFHPLAWLAARQAAVAQEQACDEAVLALGTRPSTYARVLLEVAESAGLAAPAFAALPMVQRSHLEVRVMTILHHHIRPATKRWVLIPAIVAALLTLTVAAAEPGPPSSPNMALLAKPLPAAAHAPTPLAAGTPASNAPGGADARVPLGSRVADVQQAAAHGVVKGRVVDAITGEGLADAGVGLGCPGNPPTATSGSFQRTRTDEKGEFVFEGGAGVCSVDAIKFGYAYNLNENRLFELGAGEAVVRILRLWQNGPIEGQVLDERGLAVVGTPVFLSTRRPVAGTEQSTVDTHVLTDDEGRFYFSPRQFRELMSLAVPALQLDEPIKPFVVGAGESHTVLAIRGRRLPVFRVSGRLESPRGSAQGLAVSLDQADSSLIEPMTLAQVYADDQSRFLFPPVPQGAYRLRVDAQHSMSDAVLWARMPLAVDRDRNDVSVPLSLGPAVQGSLRDEGRFKLQGTVRFEGRTPAPAPDRSVSLSFLNANGGSEGRSNVGVDAEGRFAVWNLVPGRYLLRATVPHGWSLENAMVGRQDITEVPLDLTGDLAGIVVTLTDRRTEILGVVRTAQGQEESDAAVLVFSTDRRFWTDAGPGPYPRRIRTVQATHRGSYSVAGLPPGEYFIAAVPSEDVPFMGLYDADLLGRLAPDATRVRLQNGVPFTQDLRRVVVRK